MPAELGDVELRAPVFGLAVVGRVVSDRLARPQPTASKRALGTPFAMTAAFTVRARCPESSRFESAAPALSVCPSIRSFVTRGFASRNALTWSIALLLSSVGLSVALAVSNSSCPGIATLPCCRSWVRGRRGRSRCRRGWRGRRGRGRRRSRRSGLRGGRRRRRREAAEGAELHRPIETTPCSGSPLRP